MGQTQSDTSGCSHNGYSASSVDGSYCAAEDGSCHIPAGCSVVYYGAGASYYQKFYNCAEEDGCGISCGNGNFCDPLMGTKKSCYGMVV